MAVHGRPAAFPGRDGFAYSADLLTDTTGDSAAPWGAYLFFVRWGAGEPEVTGHVESPFIVTGHTELDVRLRLGAMPLATVQATLDGLLATQTTAVPVAAPARPWWDVAATEQGELDTHDGAQ
jgi:hypothetical protein